MSFLFWSSDDTSKTYEPQNPYLAERQGYVLGEGEFLLATWNGWHTIARPTGRTRKFWHVACPTYVRYEVETVADEAGVIWGVAGERLPGTVAVHPSHVS
jgi:hypothetical protein